jgi:hypothetical protein
MICFGTWFCDAQHKTSGGNWKRVYPSVPRGVGGGRTFNNARTTARSSTRAHRAPPNKSGNAHNEPMMSAFHLIATEPRTHFYVGFVPLPEVAWLIQSPRPRASKSGGKVMPRALAVLRLITSWNLVGCSTGRPAGLAPLRIWSMCFAACRYSSGRLGA